MTVSESNPPPGTPPHPYWIDGINDPKDTSRLVKRVKLSDLMNYDPRASYKHKRLWEFHLGWAHQKYNWTSLASVRRIHAEIQARNPAGKNMSTQHIAAGNRDLVEWQYLFEDEKGKGRHGTRYSINWQLLELASKGQFPVAYPLEGYTNSVSPMGDTTVSPMGDAKSVSVSPVGDKDPTTQTRLTDGATSSSNNSAAPATPPHAAGLSAASGEAPQGERARDTQAGGFDELWAAYRFKHDRAKAKAAYAKLNPSPELHAELCTSATAWADHYEANNTEPRWRVRLHNWLAGEKYLEDVPQVYTDAKSAAISQTRGSAKPAKQPPAGGTIPAKATHAFAEGETRLTIIKADVVRGAASSTLDVTASDEDGMEYFHQVVIEHHDYETQAAGQSEKDQIVEAAGKHFGIDDSSELIGCEIVAVATGSKVKFVAPLERKPKPEPDIPQNSAESQPEPVLQNSAERAPATDYSATDAYIAKLEADLDDKFRGRKQTAQNDPIVSAPPRPPRRWVSAEIVDSDKDEDGICFWFQTTGKQRTVIHEIALDGDWEHELALICKACGVTEISDTEELHGILIKIETDDENVWGFSPANEWEVKRAKRLEREAGRREWDAAHPELFVDKPADDAAEHDDAA